MSASAFAAEDNPSQHAENVRDATVAAERIMSASRVQIRTLSEAAEFAAVERLLCDVWSTAEPQVKASTLRAMEYAGGYISGAYADEEPERLLGASIGFFASPDRLELHSHITGVRREARGRRLGTALKMHQRAWALQRGVSTISWTYDPLLRRNAHFNLVGLAATARRYVVNFYGEMDDQINHGQSSDRLVVEWELEAPAVIAAANGIKHTRSVNELLAEGAHQLLMADANGIPRVREPSAAASIALVQTPASIESMRRAGQELAPVWRLALRSALAPLMATGSWAITGFTPEQEGWYIVEATQ